MSLMVPMFIEVRLNPLWQINSGNDWWMIVEGGILKVHCRYGDLAFQQALTIVLGTIFR